MLQRPGWHDWRLVGDQPAVGLPVCQPPAHTAGLAFILKQKVGFAIELKDQFYWFQIVHWLDITIVIASP